MIPDITTGQRTYYLGVSSTTSSNTIDIPFVDTSGKNINCNYFRVAACLNSAGGNGSFVAEASGLSRTGNMVLNNIFYTATVPTSGILGVGDTFGGSTKGEAIWHGSNGEVSNGIKLRWNFGFAGSIHFAVTYGNLIPYNVLRGAQYDKGI